MKRQTGQRDTKQPRRPPDALRTYWPEFRGRVQERWSRVTDEWLDEVDGRRDRLAEKLREAYGVSEEEANRQVDDFVETHWAALSAGAPSPGGIRTGGPAQGGGVTTTPATAQTGARGGGDTSGAHAPTRTGARSGTPAGGKAGSRKPK